MKITGLIPAAGQAKRLMALPCSKELFPIGGYYSTIHNTRYYRPKPVAQNLIEQMVQAQAERIVLIINRDKFDIPRYFGSGEEFGTQIAYLIQERTSGMPDALNAARPWIADSTVVFGMPDTIFLPDDAIRQLLARHTTKNADLTLGLFPTKRPEKFGMVAFNDHDEMLYAIDKPRESTLAFMWGIACWQPVFTEFMSDFLAHNKSTSEIVLSEIFQSAMENGLQVKVLPFTDGRYIDIGTPDDLAQAVHDFSNPSPGSD